MGYRRVRARSAKSAARKAKGKNTVVKRVNYIKGSRKGKTGSYGVYTHRKKGK